MFLSNVGIYKISIDTLRLMFIAVYSNIYITTVLHWVMSSKLSMASSFYVLFHSSFILCRVVRRLTVRVNRKY